ncbi:MAG: metallophosphoesterase [Gammaproteobacteria bacterium]|nr:metallophosphoesterase [Gammaproteobacteria bacterium]MDH5652886.1 metallophosphoesterase [Gammaproteobacteria bacterium]
MFAIIFLVVMACLNVYIWWRCLRRLHYRHGKYLVLIPMTLMLGDIFFILDIMTGFIPDSPTLYLITSSFVGLTFMMFVIAVIYDLTVTVSQRVPFDQEKRRTVKLIFDVTMLIAAFTYLFRGLSQGLKDPAINPVRVKIRDFPFDKFTIVQLTDLHVGRTIKRDFMERLVERVNRLKPDMVVITGDLFDLRISHIEYDVYPLKDLQAPTYFILGNHEYFHGPGEAIEYVRSLGITPLINECTVIGEGEKQFNLIGLTDLIGHRTGLYQPDQEKCYQHVDQTKPCIVLAHQPKMMLHMDNYRCDLMLSGHTHGGQIFPFGLLVMTDQPYLAGLYNHTRDKQIFVSRGTGYWGPPLRVLAPSEITHITVTRV